jgi:hypothetical protein
VDKVYIKFFRYKEQNYVVFIKMKGSVDHYVKQSTPHPERQFTCSLSHAQSRPKII